MQPGSGGPPSRITTRDVSARSRRAFHRMRVQYSDTDQARIVHHAAYLRFAEAARVEYWRGIGFDYDRFEKETGLGLPVVEAKLRYRAPSRFDDLLELETWVSQASRASVWFDCRIRRVGDEASGVLHESSIRVACVVFKDGAIRRIPDPLLDACLGPGHGL